MQALQVSTETGIYQWSLVFPGELLYEDNEMVVITFSDYILRPLDTQGSFNLN